LTSLDAQRTGTLPTGPPAGCPKQAANNAPLQQGTQWALDQMATVEQRLMGGSVGVHPEADKQFVNVPSMVFVRGAGINGEPGTYLQQTMTLQGYTFSFVTKLVQVDWTWGDGTGDQVAGAAGLGQDVYPPNGMSSVQHRYVRIGAYQVDALEHWAVAATMTDPQGHMTTIAAATREFQRAAAATFTVVQVEGVPSR
jgi:hypothetical protein